MTRWPPRTAWLCAALALAAGAAAPARADLFSQNTDPCAAEDGFVTVATDFVIALDEAIQSGALGDAVATEVAVWFVDMQNRLIEDNDVRGACDSILRTREQYGF